MNKPLNTLLWATLIPLIVGSGLIQCHSRLASPDVGLVEVTPTGLVPATVVTSFPTNTFLEGITLDQQGIIYLSQITDGQVIRVTPEGKQSLLATLPMGKGSLSVITLGTNGNLYIGVNNSADPKTHGIWQINPSTKQAALFAGLSLDNSANGLTFDGQGNLFFANSSQGAIWRIKAGEHTANLWLQDSSFVSATPGIPGINGLQVATNNTLYATVSAKGYLVAIPQLATGGPGKPTLVQKNIPGDDFAIDGAGNFFITTHIFNTVVKVTKDFASNRVIASPDNGVIGASAAAFGRLAGDTGNLYVVTDGGAYGFDPKRPQNSPSVLKLRIYQ